MMFLQAALSLNLKIRLSEKSGNGIINDKVIAWEFRVEDLGFEGFEFYEKQSDNSY